MGATSLSVSPVESSRQSRSYLFVLGFYPVQLGFVVSSNKLGGNATMIFKMFAFAAAAIPIFLFVRSMLLRRPTRINEGYKALKKQSDLAVSIFLFLIGCVVIFAVGKLVWAWV